MRILLVEDDETLSSVIGEFLHKQNYVLDIASDGLVGWDYINTYTYDLVLLDVMLPKLDGMALCRKIRFAGKQMPVLLLTAKRNSDDKVMGLDVGADDYLVKPFDLKELAARIRALLRRGSSALAPVMRWGELELDPSTCAAKYRGQPLNLTSKEYALMELFLRNAKRVLSRSIILEHLWASDDAPSEDTVKAHIKGLRRRLRSAGAPDDFIENIYGLGYRLKPLDHLNNGQPVILIAGLPVVVTEFLHAQFSEVIFEEIPHSRETPDRIDRNDWSVLILDQSYCDVETSQMLSRAYDRLRTSQHCIIYCLEVNMIRCLPRNLIGHLIVYPYQPEELAQVIARHFNLSLPELAPEQDKSILEGMDRMWLKFQDKINQRITIIQQAQTQLKSQALDHSSHEAAIAAAHKLAGSLGMFGLPQGSEIAREIEELFVNGKVATQASKLDELLASLQNLLNQVNPEPATQTLKILDTNKPKLLIVEDDQSIARELAVEAHAWGIEAQVSYNLRHARQLVKNYLPDLVLLDLFFPNETEDGLSLLRELTTTKPPIPTIVSTMRDTFPDRLQVARLGGAIFLGKPTSATQVMQIVHQVLQQNRGHHYRVMAVDDDGMILDCLSRNLGNWGLQVTAVSDPRKFWDFLEATDPDLLILDINMPDISGLELCQVIRNDPKWSSLPVLFASAQTDQQTIQEAFRIGADDFINKPFSEAELMTRVLNRLQRLNLLRRIAETDLLTGLANRHKFTSEWERLLRLATRQRQSLCLAILDLDNFKRVNDQFGHETGDRVLHDLGKILMNSFRREDLVARWGGEEFIVAWYGTPKTEAAKRLESILSQFHSIDFVAPSQQSFRVSFSAGVVEYPGDGLDFTSLYHKADHILYRAKQMGRDRVLWE